MKNFLASVVNRSAGVMKSYRGRNRDRDVEMVYFAGGAESDALHGWVEANGGVLTVDGDDFNISFNSQGANVAGTAPGWVFLNPDNSFDFSQSKIRETLFQY